MNNNNDNFTSLHLNYSIIKDIVEEKSTILDLGCGDGTLMEILKKKDINVQGIEISQDNVVKCLEKGLSVIQGDIDKGLREHLSKTYDYVILNSTLQSTQKPDYVIKEMLRVGKKIIVSFPNFAYWRVRFYLMFKGRMPKSKMLPFEWFDTPNIHLLTIEDFYQFARENNIKIEKTICMKRGEINENIFSRLFNNFFAQEVIFICSKNN